MTTKILNKLYENSIYPDIFRKQKDGSFIVKKGYFYRNGTLEQFKDEIKKALPEAKIIDCIDEYRVWPANSYFKIIFTI